MSAILRSKILAVTSAKGGVGKTTVAANLSLALALRGRRVLALDLDFGMSCLPMLLGAEDRALFDFSDAARGAVPVERAFLPAREESLPFWFSPAPPDEAGEALAANPEALQNLLDAAGGIFAPDFTLLDTKCDSGASFKLASSVAGRALVIATQQSAALRAAEKTALSLQEKGIASQLIVNFFDIDPSRKKARRAGLLDIIDRTGVPLLGVIPRCEALAEGAEEGILADRVPAGRGEPPLLPFDNIARRLLGEDVALFTGMKHRRRRKDAAL